VYSQDGKLLYVKPSNAANGTKYIHLHNHVVAEVTGTAVQYDHTDGLGSPVALTDAAGELISRTRYEPYGATAAGATPGIGFTGHMNAPELGLVYMQQRYYDPVAGRFLSIDPVTTDANSGSNFNRYVYTANNPYRYIDPDGRQFCGSYQCEKYDSGNRPGGVEVKSTASTVGAVLGGVAGGAVAAGCDVYSGMTCAPANPAIVAGGAAVGAAVGAGVGGSGDGGPFIASSRVLAKAIVSATGLVRQQFQDTHHIVAENDPRAAASRAILRGVNMNINSAFNGMNMSALYHARLHTNVYHATVEASLLGAGSYAEVAATLTGIRFQINIGVFPF
jgi:RHS repeat-associated protein